MAVSTLKVKWDKSISVDNVELDEQHIRLLEFTNNLLLHYHEKESPEIIQKAISSLVDYCEYHFRYEELILKERGYPDLERHIDLHDRFRAKVADFQNDLNNRDASVLDNIIIYLISWIKEHTSVEDQDYKNYV